MGQVVSWERLLEAVARVRGRGGQVVFTNGCFDILHRGHEVYLGEAKGLGDILVVGLNDDASVRRLKGPGRPVNPVEVRARALSALSCVDYVLIFQEDTPERLVAAVRPDVLAKGGDYRIEEVVGGDFVRSYGGKVVTLTRVEGVSTTEILRKIQGFGIIGIHS
ncbi:MAG: D-glycero-beta-D-manno-heptose 1-phosphate adenylyltransferase [Candidatus Latescibacteria bacterium]|nr:D-glycero-beta-D-manno-heptose 1-phosphate adenylyltransferase [Candidatus Latescibacterota bacterium]